MSRSEAEKDSDGAAIAAFVFEKVHAVFWAHLL
jgi:hypothetical protein